MIFPPINQEKKKDLLESGLKLGLNFKLRNSQCKVRAPKQRHRVPMTAERTSSHESQEGHSVHVLQNRTRVVSLHVS